VNAARFRASTAFTFPNVKSTPRVNFIPFRFSDWPEMFWISMNS
jgi:hypothetical protein